MSSTNINTLDAQRQQRQLAFMAGDDDLQIGSPAKSPWPIQQLAALEGNEPFVTESHQGGLTAIVHRLRAAGGDWALKRVRARPLVMNVDGQTSFLNEVQRRADVERLKSAAGGVERWRALVDTHYASLRRGIILSPWIDGQIVTAWDERKLAQLFETLCGLWMQGLFEWDLSPGNILDDGRQIRLFDFGYMYRFDPQHHFNSAGNGRDFPMFHPVERFETRHFSALLLKMEIEKGGDAALAAFRLQKSVALDAYESMRDKAARRCADATVIMWLDGIMKRWRAGLRGDIASLYLRDLWRSHRVDLDDDLRGKSCTPQTLDRVDWLLAAVDEHFPSLVKQHMLFWDDEGKSQSALRATLTGQRELVTSYQIDRHERAKQS
jgi:hypothetical protein